MNTPTTLDEALQQGYHLGDMQYTRGYLSRKIDRNLGTQPIHQARGRRAGELYIERPAYNTSNYHFRQYLYKE